VFENIPRHERIDLAKARMLKVVDHFLYLIELHANNLHAVYTPTLSSQIPKSYAALGPRHHPASCIEKRKAKLARKPETGI
jgi:hypothetical protein